MKVTIILLIVLIFGANHCLNKNKKNNNRSLFNKGLETMNQTFSSLKRLVFSINLTQISERSGTAFQGVLAHLRSDNQSVAKNELSAKIFNSFLQRFVFGNQSMHRLNKNLLEVNLKPKCSQSLRALMTKPEEEWVQMILESSGRLPLGMISGTTFSFGDYDQCLSTKGRLNNKTVIKGKYCLMKIGIPEQKKGSKVSTEFNRITNGICIPSVCSQTEVTQLLGRGEFRLKIIVDNCSETERTPLDWPQLISIIWISFSVIAVIIGTLYDLLMSSSAEGADTKDKQNTSHQRSDRITNFFLCFSIKANSKKIFSIDDKKGKNELGCLDGLRALSCIWVTISHVIFFPTMVAYISVNILAHYDSESFSKQPWIVFMENATFSVQTFFIIGGFVSFHVMLRANKTKQVHLSVISSAIGRWARFVPTIFSLYCIQFIFPLLGDGPLFNRKMLGIHTNKCYQYWWTHLLLISNWFPLDKQCVGHTWYLSADFQISLLSHFLAVYYLISFSKAVKLNIALIIIGVLLPSLIFYVCKVPMVKFTNASTLYPKWMFHTYHHLIAYFFGTLLAAILNSRNQITISKLSMKIIWIFVLMTMLFNTFTKDTSYTSMWQGKGIPDYLLAIISLTIKRLLWSVGIGWIILSCAMLNEQGIVSKFLSANVFRVLSRLSFSVYLIHPFVVHYEMFAIRQPLLMNTWSLLMRSSGVVILSFLLGFMFNVVFEAPVVNALKLISGRKPKPRQPMNTIDTRDDNREKID